MYNRSPRQRGKKKAAKILKEIAVNNFANLLKNLNPHFCEDE
jgi:hypothetical protein